MIIFMSVMIWATTDFFPLKLINVCEKIKASSNHFFNSPEKYRFFRVVCFSTNTSNNFFWIDASYKIDYCVSIAAASAMQLEAYSRKLVRLAEGHCCQWACGFFTRQASELGGLKKKHTVCIHKTVLVFHFRTNLT